MVWKKTLLIFTSIVMKSWLFCWGVTNFLIDFDNFLDIYSISLMDWFLPHLFRQIFWSPVFDLFLKISNQNICMSHCFFEDCQKIYLSVLLACALAYAVHYNFSNGYDLSWNYPSIRWVWSYCDYDLSCVWSPLRSYQHCDATRCLVVQITLDCAKSISCFWIVSLLRKSKFAFYFVEYDHFLCSEDIWDQYGSSGHVFYYSLNSSSLKVPRQHSVCKFPTFVYNIIADKPHPKTIISPLLIFNFSFLRDAVQFGRDGDDDAMVVILRVKYMRRVWVELWVSLCHYPLACWQIIR